jgi:D-glycero-D-manno-heptose 1,7-bisphosphate phosphatase
MDRRAVFLDKDGTLIRDVPFNVDPARIEFLPGVAEGLALLGKAGFRFIVITNQPGVAHGQFEEKELKAVDKTLKDFFENAGVRLDAFYWCPHHPEGSVQKYTQTCDCRKPGTALILKACSDLGIDAKQSWFVGDILDDVEAGKKAGCRTAFVDSGNESEWKDGPFRRPDLKERDFFSAAKKILESEKNGLAKG